MSFFPNLPTDFAKTFHNKCQIDAKEGTANFVLIAYAVHELSQKSGRG